MCVNRHVLAVTCPACESALPVWRWTVYRVGPVTHSGRRKPGRGIDAA
jgi:hypothetical protein